MKLTRRTLLWSGLGATGALVVGWSGMPPRSRLGKPDTLPPAEGEVGLNGWLKIDAQGHALLAMPYAEMGQGVHTTLALLVAEELDLRPDQVRLIPATHDALYGNVAVLAASLPFHPRDTEPGHETTSARLGQWMIRKIGRELGLVMTGGSATMADTWDVLRLAAATARAQLLGAASLRWKLPVSEFNVVQGVITHPAGGHHAHYGEFAAAAATTPPGEVRFKKREQWALLGKPQKRLDIPARTNGQARYGIDTRLPGMVFAVVRHAPMLGGSVARMNSNEVLKRPGVERVLRLSSVAGSTEAVAVVGISTWHAKQASLALDIDWAAPVNGRLDSQAIQQALEGQAQAAADGDAGFSFHKVGDASAQLASAPKRLNAVYKAPYLAHATLEPMNCTAQVTPEGVQIWAPTQVPGLARAVAARVADVPEDKVTVHMTQIGGGFGRRLEVDSVAQAVRVAQETGGRPVQLVWPREEDFTHDFYRPAGVAVLQGGLDAQGQLQALRIGSAGDAITPRHLERNAPWLAGPVDTPDKTTAEGLFDLPYAIPHQLMRHVATRSGVPVGYWRSVGHSHNAFFSESFIDELAHLAGQDPVAFRLGLLKDRPRHAAVLQLAASKAGWGQALPKGQARGVALHESFDSTVAMVMEVSLQNKALKIHRVVCALDCGTAVNPAVIAQQVEGSVVFGLSAALYGRIDIVNNEVRQKNFPDSPILSLRECPPIETHIVPSTLPPTGMGEPAVPPVAPALANALFALTGQRLRELPLQLPG